MRLCRWMLATARKENRFMESGAGVHGMKFTITLIVASLMWLSICVAQNQVPANRILIVAKPVSAKFVRFDESHAVSPSFYKLKIRNARLIQGEQIQLPKEMTLSIRANHGEIIPTYDQIFLLLDATDKSKLKVITWEKVLSIACIPKSLVDARYSDFYFAVKLVGSDVLCTHVKGYVPLPE